MRKLLTFLIGLGAIVFVVVSPMSAQGFNGGCFNCGCPACAGGGGGGWCSLIPQSGLVNCWPFDTANTTTGTATDVIGGKNATLTSVTLNGSGPSTNLNNAGVFNGTSSHGDTTLSNVPTSAFSLVIWLNPTNASTSGRFFANDHTDADNKGFQARQNTTLGWMDIGNGTSSNSQFASISSGVWTMFTWTYDSTTLTVYPGGFTSTLAGPLAAGTNNAAFGFNPAYSGDFWAGKIAGVAIYNRALSPSEITTINGL